MIGFEILHVSLCVMGLLSETLCSLTVEVEAGDNATVWCQHELSDTGYIYWYKHINDSVRHLLGCKHFFGSSPSKNCIFFTESERIVMSVHGKNTSLTITAVNVSDTGLYYCSFIELDQVNFRNSTFLQVKDRNKTLSENPDRAKGSVSSVFFILNVVFGAVIVILLSVLIFIILKHRETHRGLFSGTMKAHMLKSRRKSSRFSENEALKFLHHEGFMISTHLEEICEVHLIYYLYLIISVCGTARWCSG
ncbi:uncharacterized protein LOC132872843 isoform X1 [Neoarius graeffei]|uniref:uncharacterized protein LOC132872843 isoform X1 n=1 Tax=Neoarius graeffei TaxID=443677 RepID=UPI00298CCD07|nr:uncharacterized protein LOC132872843 isoform X1 [Neoarius graeffei]